MQHTFFQKAELEDPWATLWVDDAVSVYNERATDWAAVIKYIVEVDKEVYLIIQSFSNETDHSVDGKLLCRAGLTPSVLQESLQAIKPSSVNRIIWYTHACQSVGPNKCELTTSRLCMHGKVSCGIINCPLQTRCNWSDANTNYWYTDDTSVGGAQVW